MSNQIKIICALSIVLMSCGENIEEKRTVAVVVENYKTMQLAQRPISGNVQLPGVMQPFQFVQLFPKINGFVRSVTVDRGSVVRQGQVLITLEAPEIEQQVAAAKLKYTQAQATYITSKDRYRRLLETSKTPGTVSPYDLEAAASKMQGDSATAQGEFANFRAQESYNRTQRAPRCACRSGITESKAYAGIATAIKTAAGG
jgi:membrane fusion protein, multidrug efflux system